MTPLQSVKLTAEAAERGRLEAQSKLDAALAREAALQEELAIIKDECIDHVNLHKAWTKQRDDMQQRLTAAENELAELRGKLELRDGEIWRDVKCYEGKYLVSNIGRVKAMPFDGPGKRNKEVIRWFSTDRCGYHRLNLANKGKKQNFFVHRLVAVAFIPNPENKPFVNHIDGDKFNNHYSNLEWVSSQENNLHVCRVLKKRVKPVTSICLESGAETEYPSFKAAHDLGFNRSSIAKCIAGELDSHRGFKWLDAKPTESGASE